MVWIRGERGERIGKEMEGWKRRGREGGERWAELS